MTMVLVVSECTAGPAWLFTIGLVQLFPESVDRVICPVIGALLSAGLQQPKSRVECLVSSNCGHHHD